MKNKARVTVLGAVVLGSIAGAAQAGQRAFGADQKLCVLDETAGGAGGSLQPVVADADDVDFLLASQGGEW